MPDSRAVTREDARIGRLPRYRCRESFVIRSNDGSLITLEIAWMRFRQWESSHLSSLPGWFVRKIGPFVFAFRIPE
jgi:hypothetical protein